LRLYCGVAMGAQTARIRTAARLGLAADGGRAAAEADEEARRMDERVVGLPQLALRQPRFRANLTK
jgi:hypothetical protein